MPRGDRDEALQRQREDQLRASLADAHRKVKGALRELHLACEQLDKLKETW